MEAHKVILASSSPFFKKILQSSKHLYPLIYHKGFQSKGFASILDFLYFGEANVCQEDLDSFLAIAEEIKLKGVAGQTSSVLLEEQEESKQTEATMSKELITSSFTGKRDLPPYHNAPIKHFSAVAIPNQTGTNLKALDEKVKSMMEKGLKMIPSGKHANGTANQTTSSICKGVARKAGQRILEVTLRPTIWKGYLFHVITVTRYALQETAWSCTKVDSINELYILKLIFEAELLLGF